MDTKPTTTNGKSAVDTDKAPKAAAPLYGSLTGIAVPKGEPRVFTRGNEKSTLMLTATLPIPIGSIDVTMWGRMDQTGKFHAKASLPGAKGGVTLHDHVRPLVLEVADRAFVTSPLYIAAAKAAYRRLRLPVTATAANDVAAQAAAAIDFSDVDAEIAATLAEQAKK